MRASYGGTWLIQLMVLFILLFAGYIILTIEYSKNVKVKNEMVAIIEKYDGLNEKSVQLVNNFLTASSYGTKGFCEKKDGVYGSKDLNSSILEEGDGSKEFYYCVRKYDGVGKTNYYQVTLFYKFNLPIFGSVSGFIVKGSTSSFQSHDDLSRYRDTITNY